MDPLMIALFCIIGMFILMFSGVPIAWTLGICGIVGLFLFSGEAGLTTVGQIAYYKLTDFTLTPLPLFLLMACVITATTIGTDLFESVNKWLSRLPGGLIISTIVAQAALGAAMASSLTSLLTVGKAALPEMEQRNYDRRLCLGAIATAGPLASLIPPSGLMILYAMFSQESLGRLFIAGVVPGIILTIMLSLYTVTICTIRPELAPRPPSVSWKERLVSTKKVWPIVVLMFSIIGGIYFGIVTPTEAASVGAIISLAIGIALFKIRLPQLYRILLEAALTTGIIGLLFVAANIFSSVIIISKVPEYLAGVLASMEVSRWVVMVGINLLLIILGCVMDGLTIIMVTLPVFIPLVTALGFDPIHFGVVMLVNMEIGLISPPIGMTLFMMRGVFNTTYGEVVRGCVPYLVVLLVFLGIVIAFPELSLWLPGTMRG